MFINMKSTCLFHKDLFISCRQHLLTENKSSYDGFKLNEGRDIKRQKTKLIMYKYIPQLEINYSNLCNKMVLSHCNSLYILLLQKESLICDKSCNFPGKEFTYAFLILFKINVNET